MKLLSIGVLVWIFSFSTGHAADLKQEQWIDFMTKNMPALFCKPDQYYRDCFDVTKQECEETASLAVETCILNHTQELPDVFSYDESRRWGAIIEKCVDEDYNRALGNQKLNTQECQEIK